MANTPYCGQLIDLLAKGDKLTQLKQEATSLSTIILTSRQLCDAEMIINGGFSPLTGFMDQATYEKVVDEMRLPNGNLWPIPITLDVPEKRAESLKIGERVALRDEFQNLIAILTINSIYIPNKTKEAEFVFGSADDRCHPAIEYLFDQVTSHYIGGTLEGINLPTYFDFEEIRLTPAEVRSKIQKLGWNRVVGFQTRNPMHRSHRELTVRAARDAQANILVHPVVGMTKPGDVDHYTRVRCYKEIMNYYPNGLATLSLLPLAMRMAGPREAIWHAIIRRNYGCSHFIVGRDHAGPGNNREGKSFYDPYAAQELVKKYASELGIEILYYQMVVYVEDLGEYRCSDEIPTGKRVLNISGTELRNRLFRGNEIPEWFSYGSVVKILRQTYPPRAQQGFTLFFTGLSGAGKSTVANAVRVALLEEGSRPVSLLDGDELRTHLSSDLGFTRHDRDINIRRIGYVAAQVAKARGIAITAAIAPYREARNAARRVVSKHGGFIEIFIATPIEVCEQRDRKGLYAKARKGLVKGFTGIDDPYEAPESPELTIDTSKFSIKQSLELIMQYLEKECWLQSKHH
eukprot:TRINITY_DN25_c1_g1_i1.p1 TRINITY_DN25_c1_g1~~TRINITY_DN25_c1_g1_i1.p1  ORF type:complete len:574 (-),score=324.49 TRINITY_DN25_c1_g1_i1:182-1903(-)